MNRNPHPPSPIPLPWSCPRWIGVLLLLLPLFPVGSDAQTLFFVENSVGPQVMAMNLGGGAPSVYFVPPAPFTTIVDIAVDSQGRLFLSLTDGGTTAELHRVDVGGSHVAITPNLGISMRGLHVGASGQLFFVEQITDVARINSDGSGHTTLFSTVFDTIHAVSTDALGSVFFSSTSIAGTSPPNGIRMLETLGGTSALTVQGSTTPSGTIGGLHVAPCGPLLFTESSGTQSTLYRIDAAGPTPVHSVATPQSLSGSHVADGAGGTLAILKSSATGSQDRIIQINGAGASTIYQAPPQSTIESLALWTGPCPQPTAASGSVGATVGGPFDVLTINGFAGGPSRQAAVSPFQSISVGVNPAPGSTPFPSFILWGLLGRPEPAERFSGPATVGDLCFEPCLLNPTNPDLFTLVDGYGIAACPSQSGGIAPWSLTLPSGLPMEFEVTLQGLIDDATSPSGLATTNALVLRVSYNP